eukprot:CAMPEP_0177601274 /NCGR_PEP_ID=MMETSP0419_2-20121207/14151_1 /TAXON_ID=582737 /ORGANISM="Tetraselmis sp., Strain GSL018" /LENGTH=70 /DNA_ID=CAMNT_0019094487 /DNA_START=145 /DNA_END=357 /DNA_ORIENTATION=+
MPRGDICNRGTGSVPEALGRSVSGGRAAAEGRGRALGALPNAAPPALAVSQLGVGPVACGGAVAAEDPFV